jgi:hypothetical protein
VDGLVGLAAPGDRHLEVLDIGRRGGGVHHRSCAANAAVNPGFAGYEQMTDCVISVVRLVRT